MLKHLMKLPPKAVVRIEPHGLHGIDLRLNEPYDADRDFNDELVINHELLDSADQMVEEWVDSYLAARSEYLERERLSSEADRQAEET